MKLKPIAAFTSAPTLMDGRWPRLLCSPDVLTAAQWSERRLSPVDTRGRIARCVSEVEIFISIHKLISGGRPPGESGWNDFDYGNSGNTGISTLHSISSTWLRLANTHTPTLLFPLRRHPIICVCAGGFFSRESPGQEQKSFPRSLAWVQLRSSFWAHVP